jgi:uncharacterized protein YlxW (UPF0749 family)
MLGSSRRKKIRIKLLFLNNVLLVSVLLTAVYLHWDYKTDRVEQLLINARLNVENRELAAKDLQLQEDIIRLNSLIDDQNNKILELQLAVPKKK